MRMTSKVYVLRWGHRSRDLRLTSHIVLAARALGASGLYLSDVADRAVKRTVDKVVEEWGGEFEFKMAVPWRKTIQEWRDKATIVHLTMYGENIEGSDVMKRIKKTGRVVLVIVGSRKVPSVFYSISDFNVAVGNQPHSEVAALSVFLDRFFEGKELLTEFDNVKQKIIPSRKGKKVQQVSSP